MKIKKRFIAGAVCPECKAVDSLMLYMENNVEQVECVDCGHKKSQTDKQVSQAAKQPGSVIGIFKPE
ncbi:YheV family putative metal-binding protein [Catenovulum sp. SM1970]|uniref:YheV family putative zinc ribbon protein n=1 Tax=Marinifaba aquimaris TaxID=2741323 RepID=UPI001572520B|nr:YheV family putative zinc ribbon protein [Marinifaba aquimaris]NTS75685.1 YheV family putative metal-binding protein [Marinifaba aquimaris]